jgi:glutamine cyclotransferase
MFSLGGAYFVFCDKQQQKVTSMGKFFLSKYEGQNWQIKKNGNFMLISDMEEYFQKNAPKNVVPEDRSPKKIPITHKNVSLCLTL